jgi:hypothetical protein
MNERRYDEEEVREIFDTAAESSEPGPRARTRGTEFTLSELQDIGREVGLPPERIAEAAAKLDLRRDALPRRTYLGIPVAVGRSIELPRALTDDEWGILVAELRSTFNARGRVESEGNLRSWTNGNLHVYVEPTDSGHRLRMRTAKTGAIGRILVGVSGIVVTWILIAVLALNGQLGEGFPLPVLLGTFSLATLGTSVFGLPRWANERDEQMTRLAGWTRALLDRQRD